MKYNIIIRPEAELELTENAQWYEKNLKGLGSDFLLRVDDAIESILNNPEMFPVVYKNVRRTLIHKFPYAIFYLIENNNIIVLAIFHAKRDPKTWKSRA